MDTTSTVIPTDKPADGKRLRILLCCYSCGPDRGSEPGVGWNAALALAALHEVHVLTSSEFQSQIELRLQDGALPKGLHFHFFKIPSERWMGWFASGLTIRLHYVLWQRCARRYVRNLHEQFQFDTAQHITFVRYCGASCIADLGIPYIFGPVGGAETSPPGLAETHSLKGRMFEVFRFFSRWLGEHSPRVLKTIRNASYILAVTSQTYERCIALGASPDRTEIYPAIGLSTTEFEALSKTPIKSGPLCFFGFGRLVNLKRYDLALRAFAQLTMPDSRLLFIGGGPEEGALRQLANRLGILDKMTITGFLPREQALKQLENTHILVHPCLHDSGGCACLESMAAGRPVICLDWAGPGTLVTNDCGALIPVVEEKYVVQCFAEAMQALSDHEERRIKSEASKRYVKNNYLWTAKAEFYSNLHFQIYDTKRKSCQVTV